MQTNRVDSFDYCEKPASVSYEAIHELLWESNIHNRKQGFFLSTSMLCGDMLKQRIGNDGFCFVALDGEKLIGTLSIRFVERNKWYAKGKIPDYILAGVLPEYQGRHINSRLSELAFRKLMDLGHSIVELDTAEHNEHAIAVYEHLGFKKVGFKSNIGGDHYSVVMAKWLKPCKFSEFEINLRYLMKKIYTKCRYTIDGKKRFGV